MEINDVIQILILSALISLLISFPIIYFLYKLKIVRLIDKDFTSIIESRRLKVGTPLMGGLIVVIAVLVVNFFLNLNGTTKVPLVVFCISAMLGAFDDVLNIYGRERSVRSITRTIRLARIHASPIMRIFYVVTLPWAAFRWVFYLLGSNPGKGIQSHEKIIVQILAGAIVGWWIYFATGWHSPGEFWIPGAGSINLGVLIIPFIIFVVVATANAVNITDGMDGLSAGLLLSSFVGFMIVSLILGNVPIALLCASLIGSLAIYLYFNIPPARFQMGDVGSLALGALLAVIAFALDRFLLLPIFGFFFFAEIASVVVQGMARRFLGRRLLKMSPIHHHLEIIGWSEPKIVMRFWILSVFLIVIGVWVSQY
ncbi:MAG: phospho-N-acetylmuramoyl-pentapeptide-transferase [Patescibacteria group bacterium]|nr:phospho-N-acetylmuramoyl-pentapeptide-transferase [Patescibacteria group bacterium]